MMLEDKQRSARNENISEEAVILSSGYLESTSGVVITSETAMMLASAKSERDGEKRSCDAILENTRVITVARSNE